MAKTSNGTRSWSIALFSIIFSGMGALAMAGYHHAERKGHPVMETRVGRLERDYAATSKSLHRIEQLVLRLSISAGIDISIP